MTNVIARREHHNRIDELKTPLGITDCEINRILPPVEKPESAPSEKEERE